MAPSKNGTRAATDAAPKERNHTMNAQLTTTLRRIGLPAFSAGMGALLVVAAIFAATLSRPAAPAPHDALRQATHVAPNPNRPISGTGSAYDGRDYSAAAPRVSSNSNVPISGTGSAYNGQ